jgi:hypothetical protein
VLGFFFYDDNDSKERKRALLRGFTTTRNTSAHQKTIIKSYNGMTRWGPGERDEAGANTEREKNEQRNVQCQWIKYRYTVRARAAYARWSGRFHNQKSITCVEWNVTGMGVGMVQGKRGGGATSSW